MRLTGNKVGAWIEDRALPPFLALCFLFGAFLCARPEVFSTSKEAAQRRILIALRDRQQNAIQLATQYCEQCPVEPFGIWLLAEALTQNGEHDEAIEQYKKLPQDSALWEFERSFGLGKRFYALGRVADAEVRLRRATQINRFHLEANERLGHLLNCSGRAWESAPYFFVQLQRGKCRGDEILAMSACERLFRRDERFEDLYEKGNRDVLPIQLAAARRAIFDNDEVTAEKTLREITTVYPHLGEAQGRLGRIIVDRGDLSEFLQWRGALPDEARNHPEVFYVEGLQAERIGQPGGAARCFLQVLALSPHHLGATIHMAECLEQLQYADLAKEFGRRAVMISSLEQNYNLIRSRFDFELAFKVIKTLDDLGRYWESAGWFFVMSRFDHPPPDVSSDLKAHLSRARMLSGSMISPERLPANSLRLDDFPIPQWPIPAKSAQESRESSHGEPEWRFSDDAAQAGIQFEYFEGTDESNRLHHIFNVMGGGLGAFDFDNDGWPDLYVAQGNNWRESSLQRQWTDRLYRNSFGTMFFDVTNVSGINETRFSHGVGIGDFNQDGFSDVYVGNLGPNSLFRNNGDGTFSDVTNEAGVAGNEWSTNSAFADFTGDGLPDLFVLNYTKMEETRERECLTEGVPVACTPDVLNAEFDRFYVNQGDGTYRDVSAESGMFIKDGKGLGVVVWDFEKSGRLSVFVANDTTPNYLLINRGVTGGIPKFTDEAKVRGIAFDQDGNSQANMGVAAGDVNRDGILDLFVTTFFGDSKTLHLGQENGFFTNSTRPYRMREPGFWMNGFGCQFVDLDGDGWEDIVTTNGHVDQRTPKGTEDRMPPQLFRNIQGRSFAEISGKKLGPFFQGKYIGRGLAIFDWNRDGLTDFGVSHIHAPFALVTNRTNSAGQPLVVRLVGTSGAREAVGATVIAESGGRTVFRMMTAGDGFLVSNERRLQFSIPDAELIDRLTVRWLDGREESWRDLSTGQEILIIEGRGTPVTLRFFGSSNQQP